MPSGECLLAEDIIPSFPVALRKSLSQCAAYLQGYLCLVQKDG